MCRVRSRILIALVIFTVTIIPCLGASANAADQTFQFDIPAEPLGQALVDFAKASSQEVVFSEDLTDGKSAAVLRGQYTISGALKALLAGTDLTVDVSVAGAVMVLPKDYERIGNCSMSKTSLARVFNAGVSAAALSLCSSLAWAQDTETVMVTGSRVVDDTANSPTPLTSISADVLETTTPTNTIADALNKLPQFVGSSQPRWAGNGSSLSGENALSLRNLGTARTLVLFDGERLSTTDIDTLPQELISRVDVVTGGASSVYGSDAVAGVVNFILDKHFNGVKVDAQGGISTFGDAASHKIDLVAGTDLFGGRGHIEAAISDSSQDAIYMGARKLGALTYQRGGAGTTASPYYNAVDTRLSNTTFGGLIACSGCAANGEQFVAPGVIGPFVNGTATGVANLQQGGDGAYDDLSSIIPTTRANNAFTRFSYDINDTTSFYVQGMAAESYSNAPWINDGTTTATGLFYANNPFLPAAAQAALSNGTTNKFQLSEYFYGPGAANESNVISSHGVNRNLEVTAGADGTLAGRFAWDFYYTHGEDRATVTNVNNEDTQKLYAAEDAVPGPNGSAMCYVSTTQYANLYPGCTPIDPFGPNTLTPQQLSYITTDTHYTTTNYLDDVGSSISGPVFDSWAGPVKAALSFNARWVSSDTTSNALPTTLDDCTGLRLCSPTTVRYANNTVAPSSAGYNVWEIAGEAEVPLLKDVPFAQSLDANLAGRYTDYSTSGPVQTWKIGLDHHVNDDVMFRGTTSIDIRAPGLSDLFAPVQQSTTGYFDLHTNTTGSVFLRSQGNSNLVPEVARTYTGGMVLTPSAVPGLMVSLDYYRIDLKNAITSASLAGGSNTLQVLCESSGGTSPFCSLAVRPLPFSNTTSANYPTLLLSEELNTASLADEGWDLEASYHFDLGDVVEGAPGAFNLRVFGNYSPVYESVSIPGTAPSYSYDPKTRITTFVNYTVGNWQLDLENQWIDSGNKATTATMVYSPARYAAYDQTDITITRKFVVDGSVLNAYLGVSNVLDVKPPLFSVYATNPGLAYPGPLGNYGGVPYDVVGRYFTLGVHANL
jgi:iron complex outermembrane recepter protein